MKINERASQVYLKLLIRDHILPLLRKNYTFLEIQEKLGKITGKSSTQCARYIKKATDTLKANLNRDIEEQRIEMIESLREDMRECYANYKKTQKLGWFREYQDVKARTATFTPNELKPIESEKEAQKIEITYKKVVSDD